MNKNRYWTAEELERAKIEGRRIARYLKDNAPFCLLGCKCGICGGDPAKQEPDKPS